ncbi:MAG: plasmid replication initiator [Hyphomicrobiales bacterium]|nr:MAG: plasmid replication initiator [Hyphomicrobiales bacterium]
MVDNQLIPEKYPQGDLFICDVSDAILKDIMPQMEHPFYSLSKKPEMNIRRYENNGNWLEVIPSFKGLATIYDKDILIYAISQIMAKLNQGEKVTQRVRINSNELLMFTNRGTGGKDYKALSEALDRLAGTRIKTNIVTGDEEQTDNFGLINATSIKRKNGLDGRLLWCELELSNWVFNAIKANEVLTLNRAYFRLRKPIERRIYEIARKHCGRKKEWSIGLVLLYKKSGSQGNIRLFKQSIKNLVSHNHLPDYTVEINEETDKITFKNREKWWKEANQIGSALPPFSPLAFEEAKKFAPNYDVYYLEREFREWWSNSGKSAPDHLTKAFVGFCKARHKRKPYP